MQIHVTESSAVGEARRIANELSDVAGFAQDYAGRAALIASEMATNLLKHAQEGDVFISDVSDASGPQLQLLSIDRGPGMADLQRCMTDGFSTAGSQGTGLGAMKRMASEFECHSVVGAGTVMFARVRGNSAPASSPLRERVGSIISTYPGEIECGDALSWHADSKTLFVADGLGHGAGAAQAVGVALEIFNKYVHEDCLPLMHRLHKALAATRGAVAALARVDVDKKTVRIVSVGNIAASFVSDNLQTKMVSLNGTLGHKVAKIAEFTYPYVDGPMLILHSDGLSARWNWTQYPELAGYHPGVIAGVLYQDHRRHNDDATVAVVRMP